MHILQGILFGTFAVVLVGNLPRLTKTVFFLKVWSLLKRLWALIAQF